MAISKERRIALLVFVAACQATGDRPVARSDADVRALLARQWELSRLGSQEIPPPPPGTPPDSAGRDLVPGRRPTIRFMTDPPAAGGRSFCNGYGGPYELRGDSLRFAHIESTAVGCDGPDSLETRFFRALWRTRRIEVDSARLVLIAADAESLVFVR